MLTKRQEVFFNLIKTFYEKEKDLPTLNDLKKISCYKSYNTIYKYLKLLEAKDYLVFDKSRKKITFIKDTLSSKDIINIPFITNNSYLKLDKIFFKENKHYIAYRITNNSLKNLLIQKGDVLIINKANNYLEGKIVMILKNEKISFFKYNKKDGFIHLTNDFDTLVLKNNNLILGKVVLVIHQMI